MPASLARVVWCSLAALALLSACAPDARRPPRGNGSLDGPDKGDVGNSPCLTTADCKSGVCDRSASKCVECRVSSECSSGQRCENSVCRDANACAGDLDCTSSGSRLQPHQGPLRRVQLRRRLRGRSLHRALVCLWANV